MPRNAKNYTDPELREQVKNEVQQGDKGGKPGQWSARKAQMTASEYKARGGDYTTSKDEKKPEQKSLDQWTDEEWQTKEGSGTAKQDDGTRKRYLPNKAWEKLDEGEKQATEEKKREGSKAGKQFVGNTAEAKRKRREVTTEGDKKEKKKGGRGKRGGHVDRDKEEDNEEDKKQEDEEGQEQEEGREDEEEEDDKNMEDEDDDQEEAGEGETENEAEGDSGDQDESEEDEEEEQNQQVDEGTERETETPEGEQPEKKRRKQK
ncbi:hypothetical protein BDW66DRAFT_153671 [Aspergillus desertorum]